MLEITIIMLMNIVKLLLIVFLNVKMYGLLIHNNIKYVQKNHYVKMLQDMHILIQLHLLNVYKIVVLMEQMIIFGIGIITSNNVQLRHHVLTYLMEDNSH